MTANPMPDPFTPTGVTEAQLEGVAEHCPDPVEEFFASGFTQRQLDDLADHASFFLRRAPELRVVADAIDRARDWPWRQKEACQ